MVGGEIENYHLAVTKDLGPCSRSVLFILPST